ncbi:MAG: c-type cytochrome biogenesis protein CcmI [Gammaproteobacteria bacterium]|nr:c-type cytochrome biogenesis protein CcmI [Gammaproteobacteria bacterium]MDH3858197.1 c-type cytochrome biogenesis protein CcmI [Gammaproteobacteria bacterium]
MSFWIIAIALLALALVILLVPLVRSNRAQQHNQRQQQNIQIAREQKRQLEAQLADGEIDQDSYDSALVDLQTSLALELEGKEADSDRLRGKWMAVVVLLAIPLSSVALYLVYGEYRVIKNPELARAVPAQQTAAAPQMTLDEMIVAIKDRLRANPEDAEGWFMLGRSYMGKQQYSQAVTAFQRSHDLIADEPGIMFALADALAMQNNGNLLGEPEKLVKRGLELAPRFPNGLWLAGMAAEQRQDYKTAHRHWTQLLPLIADNPNSTREIRDLIAMLEERDPELASKAINKATLNVVVDIIADLKSRANPGAAVFIYAKAMQGPPMPLAVRKLQLSDLPATLTLSDDDAMMPTMKLSTFDQVIVGARVSSSGNPVAQAGDFYTELEAVDSSNPPEKIVLTIDQVK